MIEGLKILQTLGGNKKGFSKLQCKRALVARNIYRMVGEPNFQILRMVIRQKIIQNCPVTVEDIGIAEKIFGNGVFTLKGITTRKIPKVVEYDFIEIPREMVVNNQELILCMDIMFINQLVLFTKIDKDIRFQGLVPLSNTTK